MDKGWMSKSRLSKEYYEGVEAFLNFAILNGKDPNAMSCPCVKCGNLRDHDTLTIRAHLTYNGIDQLYRVWILHGETYTSDTTDKDKWSTPGGDFYSHDQTVNMVHSAYVDNSNQFHKVLEEAEMPLYPECAQFTKLSAIVKLYNLKTKYGWNDTSFTELLLLIKEMLPNDNVLPHSLYDARRSLFGTLLNIPGKTKDGVKARLDLVDMNLREDLAPKVGEKKTYLPPAIYTLSKKEKQQVCAFVGPQEKANIIHERMIGTLPNQLLFLPCNVGYHWILMVIDPHKEIVYVLDPLRYEAHVEEWKNILIMAHRQFNMSIGKRGRSAPLWEVIKCQQQPDGEQCGFYVMRYMKDIIENKGSSSPIPMSSLFSETYYSRDEIDEVRTEWADFVEEFTE